MGQSQVLTENNNTEKATIAIYDDALTTISTSRDANKVKPKHL